MIFEKTLNEVVDENLVYAKALHYLGVDFFNAPERSLGEICDSLNLQKKQIVNTFTFFESQAEVPLYELSKLSLKGLVQYLSHTHAIFIKDKLPYIVHLIKNWDGDALITSLIPVFVEDFIKHIYEEEDLIFKYVNWLVEVNNGEENKVFPGWIKFQSVSIQEEFLHHKNEDEFANIRSLVNEIEPKTLHERVILNEINSFDKEMKHHAKVENHLFFPEAIELEKNVFDYLKKLSQLN